MHSTRDKQPTESPPRPALRLSRYVLSYLAQFMAAYPTARKAATALLMEAHDGGRMTNIGMVDQPLADLLRGLKKSSATESTVIAILADHGGNNGVYHDVFGAGNAERRLPVLLLLVPARLLHTHPTLAPVLEHNQQMLVTSYDLFKTFRDILHYPAAPPGDSGWCDKRSFSLVRQRIPENRTCHDASVPPDHCLCGKSLAGHWVSEKLFKGL